ncbi:hypothetical protein SAMN05421858_2735 [Haladaptatus litoreus]|uniref:Uncharacterized protein n=1 Tax=Haladaptatus litoreus TaxID=553468 RepID=A0A1N7BSU6_9EURY|nr:hypothetical protein [Haladaptatus litoreus]SIR54346.1 hypothetical protein SAMN05421858_2735 [Haladaptatus litoreus]
MNRIVAVVGLFVLSGLLIAIGAISLLIGFALAPEFIIFGALLALLSTILGAIVFALEET